MSKFSPKEDEKIYIEGRATYIKSVLNVTAGYAFLTSKRLVFADFDNDILFSIPISDISDVREGKYGLTKKTTIATMTGDEYSIQFDPHDKWFALIKNPTHLTQNATETTVSDAKENDKNWYYEVDNKRVGPVSSQTMKQFVKNNHTIYRFTKVWCDGMSEWKKAEETELDQYFEGPPPLTGDSVNNTIVWILAFAPIIGINIQSFVAAFLKTAFHTSPNMFLIWMINPTLNIVLALLDERKLTAAGHNVRALGIASGWLVPVYLFQRAKALKQSLAYFIVWIISFGLIFLF